MSNKQEISNNGATQKMTLNGMARTAIEARRAANLNASNRRQRVSDFRTVLQRDSLGFLTIPRYYAPYLTADQQLQLILQDAVLNADAILTDVDEEDDQDE